MVGWLHMLPASMTEHERQLGRLLNVTPCTRLGAPASSWLAAELTPLWVHSASSQGVDRAVH